MNEMDVASRYRGVQQLKPDAIADRLKSFIQNNGPLPERLLADNLGIKRHQVRRGLEVLRERGEIARPKPRRKALDGNLFDLGDIVGDTNPVQVLEMRCMIEPTLARVAALRATPKQIDGLRKAVALIANGKKSSPDLDLHALIAAAAGNALAERIHRVIRAIERDARMRSGTQGARDLAQPEDLAGHHAIVEAIAARDADGAERAMHDHLDAIRMAITGAGR